MKLSLYFKEAIIFRLWRDSSSTVGVVASFVLFGLTACSTPETRAHERSEAFTALPETFRSAVLKGEIIQGMDTNAVYIALGQPTRVETSTERGVPLERWIYTSMESVEVPAWNGTSSQTVGEANIAYPHYNPLKFTRPQESFEVKFKNGKVVGWKDL